MPSNGGAKLNYGPIHNNSNLTCAIEIRRGGEDVNQSDVLEAVFIPLDCKYQIHPELKMFQVKMRPSWPVDTKTSKLNSDVLSEYKKSPHDQVGGLDLLTRWIDETLQLKTHKKIIPLTWDWSDVRPFLKMWMGDATFQHYISDNHRELKSMLNFVNDRCDFWGEEVTFKMPVTSQLFKRLNIDVIERNSLSAKCFAYIQSYRELLRRYIPGYTPKD